LVKSCKDDEVSLNEKRSEVETTNLDDDLPMVHLHLMRDRRRARRSLSRIFQRPANRPEPFPPLDRANRREVVVEPSVLQDVEGHETGRDDGGGGGAGWRSARGGRRFEGREAETVSKGDGGEVAEEAVSASGGGEHEEREGRRGKRKTNCFDSQLQNSNVSSPICQEELSSRNLWTCELSCASARDGSLR
jgi:hypothetical protein